MSELARFDHAASAEQICQRLERDAAVVVEGVLAESDLRAAHAELSPYFESAKSGRNDFAGFHTQRIGARESAQVLHRDRGVWGGRVPRRS
jgi:hypothetical protein